MNKVNASSAGSSRSPVLDKPWHRPGASRYAVERLRNLLKPPGERDPAPDDVAVGRDLAVPTRDGTLLRANVFRSRRGDGPKPVFVSVHAAILFACEVPSSPGN